MAGAKGIGSAAFVLTKREQYQPRSGPKTNSPRSRMYKTKAYAAGSATSLLTSATIPRRDPTDRDMQIEILFCGICHSDLHYARDEWHDVMPTVYPYGGYSDSIVVDEGFVLHILANGNFTGTAPVLCAGITTHSPEPGTPSPPATPPTQPRPEIPPPPDEPTTPVNTVRLRMANPWPELLESVAQGLP